MNKYCVRIPSPMQKTFAGKVSSLGLIWLGLNILLLTSVSALGQDDGSIVSWGFPGYDLNNVPEPNTDFVAVAGGQYHSLGLKSDGTISAWGDNGQGRCNVPEPNADFVAVAGGAQHSLGLKADGTVVAWGWNDYGQCNVPEPNADFVAIAGGTFHSLGLKSDGSIVVWGTNYYGIFYVPEPNANFVAVASGSGHGLGLKSDGSIVVWGDDDLYQDNVPEPNEDFMAVAAYGHHNLGLKSDGSIVAWGGGADYGQWDVPEPNADFVAISAGAWHSLGLKSDGSIEAWGRNHYGQCNIPAPNLGFVAVGSGSLHSLGAKGMPTESNYEIISVTADQTIYQNGVDTAIISVITECTEGDNQILNLDLTLNPKIGPAFYVGSDQFTLGAGEQQVSQFSFEIPDTSYTWEFDAIGNLASQDKLIFELTFNEEDVFQAMAWDMSFVADIADGITEALEGVIDCVQAINGMLPGGVTANSMQDLLDSATRAALIGEEQEVVGAYGELLPVVMEFSTEYAKEVGPQIAGEALGWGSLMLSSYEVARDCFGVDLSEYLNGAQSKAVIAGAEIDTLMKWMETGASGSSHSFADLIFVEGQVDVSVHFDGAYADKDSTGLIGVHFFPVGDHSTIVGCSKGIRRFAAIADTNAFSQADVILVSQGTQDLQVGLFHRNQALELEEIRFPSVSVGEGAKLRIELSAQTAVIMLQVDFEGDGFFDEQFLPGGQVVGVLEGEVVPAVRLQGAFPNPFNPQTTISFELQSEIAVNLRIYDVSGRLVDVLVDGEIAHQGRNEVAWQGRDQSGRQLPSGTYFYRLEAGGYVETKRMTLLK